MNVRRVSTDDLGVVAFVLAGRPNAQFDLHEWPDGSFSLELVDADADRTAEETYDLRSA